MRSLLIEDGKRLILVDTGIGDKQSEKFFSHYHLHGTDSLHGNLAKLGFHASDITDVILTHLHFDHCGGAIAYDTQKEAYRTVFPNATYWSSENHWRWATQPNPREKASFLSENILPIQESGNGLLTQNALPGIDLSFFDGHTESMMLPQIQYKGRTLVFMADLLPSTGHIPLPYVMGYDTRPLLTLTEKERFLNEAADNEYVLFLEHDAVNECCTVQHTEKGIRLKDTFSFADL
jgi:glyoxylase-like metal-dependent hydrolase (beta-lactamase superfamily II)